MGMIGYYFRLSTDAVEGIQSGEVSMPEFVFGGRNDDCLMSIDKAWHAIYFTLTGEVAEADDEVWSNLMFGEDLLTEEDMGYGPASLIGVQDVQRMAEELEKISREQFREQFDLQAMLENDVYPVMQDEGEEEFFDYVWENFVGMQKFFRQAANAGECVSFFIS